MNRFLSALTEYAMGVGAFIGAMILLDVPGDKKIILLIGFCGLVAGKIQGFLAERRINKEAEKILDDILNDPRVKNVFNSDLERQLTKILEEIIDEAENEDED